MAWIHFLRQELGIETKMVFASEYGIKTASTERLADLCEAVGADQYLAGADGKNYMDFSIFENRQIGIETQDYQHPDYPQLRGKNNKEFISHLCALDLLLNCGSQPGAF